MYILTNSDETQKNAILFFAISCEEIEVGEIKQKQYHFVEENGQETNIPSFMVEGVYEVSEIPEGIEAEKYCYTKKDGFYKNPNYIAPPQPIEEHLEDIEAALCELAELIVGGNE